MSRESLSKRQSQWIKTNPTHPLKLDDDEIIAPSPRRTIQMLDTMPVPTNMHVYETNIDLLHKLDLIYNKIEELSGIKDIPKDIFHLTEDEEQKHRGTMVGNVVEEINNNTNNIINKLENVNTKLDIIYDIFQQHQQKMMERLSLLEKSILESRPRTPEKRFIQPPHFELPKIDSKPVDTKEKDVSGKDISVKDNLSLLKKNVTFVLENNKEYLV